MDGVCSRRARVCVLVRVVACARWQASDDAASQAAAAKKAAEDKKRQQIASANATDGGSSGFSKLLIPVLLVLFALLIKFVTSQ